VHINSLVSVGLGPSRDSTNVYWKSQLIDVKSSSVKAIFSKRNA